MTRATTTLLAAFDALPDTDREELLAELLRRAAFTPHDLPDDDLVAAADRRFVELDRRE